MRTIGTIKNKQIIGTRKRRNFLLGVISVMEVMMTMTRKEQLRVVYMWINLEK